MSVAAVRKTIPFENAELEIWRAQSRRAQQQGRADLFILRFYGNADRADRWAAMEAEMWNDRAVEIWGMNYPGFGGSTGPARLARIGPAAVAAFDALRREAGDAPIVAYGASIGVTAALHVASSRPTEIAGLILHNPAPLREVDFASIWLVESVAVGRSGRTADPARPRLHRKRRGESMRRQYFYWLKKMRSWRRVFTGSWFRHTPAKNASSNCPVPIHNDPIEGNALADLNDALGWLLTTKKFSASAVAAIRLAFTPRFQDGSL